MTNAEISDKIMRGDTDDLTRQDIEQLYHDMPNVANAVWQNIVNQREAQKAQP